MPSFKDRDALYYPYVHVRDIDWLKRTLLVFPHVVRMVPKGFRPRDAYEIQQFCRVEGKRGALLRQAKLDSRSVVDAQAALLRNIQHDVEIDPRFLARFGRAAADATRIPGDPGFQMYPDKISDPLFYFLSETGLAWQPNLPDHENYMELHPRIGQAVMATVAIACARAEGLAIVTDETQRNLNQCLATKDVDAVYATWVHGNGSPSAPKTAPEGKHLLEIIVYQHCDTSELTPEKLARLSEDRQPIANLHNALQELASTIPDDIEDEETLSERLQAGANDALKRWQQDRVNLSALGKEIYRSEGIKGLGKLFGDVLAKMTLAGGAAVGATSIVGLTSGQVLAMGGSVAVGVLFNSVATLRKQANDKDPYRYLTMMKKAGVAFTVGR